MDRYIKKVLVIGNGFDLNLKLKTRFSDFARSAEWKELYQQKTMVRQSPLLQYLYGKSFIDEWFDIEKALYEYVLIKADGSYATKIDNDKRGYNAICDAFCKYLKNQVFSRSCSIDETSAGKLLKKMCSWEFIDYRIYSFNYTPIDLYAKVLNRDIHVPEITYIHGDIHSNTIILGIENVDINSISPGYSFLFKSNNMNYKPTDFVIDCETANEVIIFGHSLNDFDFVYFREYITTLIEKKDKSKKLTIITLDELSKTTILDNMRRQGISIVELYQHSILDFILTSNIEEKQSPDYDKFCCLLKRIH